MHGRKEDIKENPPMVIIEFYDQDKVWLFLYYCFNIQILFSSTRQSSSDELLPSLMYFWRKIWYFSKNLTIKENVVIKDTYQAPSLEWYQIQRGSEDGGN